MNKCIECKKSKDLDDFYDHPKNRDKKSGCCKECQKERARVRYRIKRKDKVWVESERERGREKYSRLNYKDRAYSTAQVLSPKLANIYKNQSRNRKAPKGCEQHHWSYDPKHFKDTILLDRVDHRRLHTKILKTQDGNFYKIKDDGKVLDTKQKHLEFIGKCGIEVKPF